MEFRKKISVEEKEKVYVNEKDELPVNLTNYSIFTKIMLTSNKIHILSPIQTNA